MFSYFYLYLLWRCQSIHTLRCIFVISFLLFYLLILGITNFLQRNTIYILFTLIFSSVIIINRNVRNVHWHLVLIEFLAALTKWFCIIRMCWIILMWRCFYLLRSHRWCSKIVIKHFKIYLNVLWWSLILLYKFILLSTFMMCSGRTTTIRPTESSHTLRIFKMHSIFWNRYTKLWRMLTCLHFQPWSLFGRTIFSESLKRICALSNNSISLWLLSCLIWILS